MTEDRIDGENKDETKIKKGESPDALRKMIQESLDKAEIKRMTREQRYENFYKNINERLAQFNINSIDEFGTPGGNDLDLRIYFDEIPDEETLDEIRDEIGKFGLESHVFFSKQSEWEDGKIFETRKDVKPVVDAKYLTDGVDLHEVDVELSDYSLLQLYLAATSRTIQKDGSRVPSEISKRAIDNINLTQEGGSEFAHLYTADFLHDYINLEKRDDESEHDFEKRIAKKRAKTLIRVALGNTIANTPPEKLPEEKMKIAQYLNDPTKGKSMDERLSKYIRSKTGDSTDPRNILLFQAAKIRNGETATISYEDFNSESTQEIFYLAFQQGMEQRIKEGGEVQDTLSAYALTALFDNLAKSNPEKYKDAISRVTINPGENITTIGEINDNLYIIPVRNSDKKLNPSATAHIPTGENIEIGTGRIVGLGVFSEGDIKATATVSAKDEPIEVIKIDGELIRSMLTSGDIHEELTNPTKPISTPEAKALDVFLRMNAYEMISRLNNYAGFTTAPHRVETADVLMENNAFAAYFDSEKLISIVSERFEEERKITNYKHAIDLIESGTQEKNVFEKDDKQNGKLYAVKKGSVKIKGIGPNGEDLILPEGSVFGESILAGINERGATATLEANSQVFEVDADWFIKRGNLSNPDLLYHLAALNFGRVRNRLKGK